MRIAIPVDSQCLEARVAMSFGRTPYFLIYDVDTKDSIFIYNIAADSTGGAGIRAAQSVVDNKVDVLITPRLGENAANVVKAAGIKVYRCIDGTGQDNIDAYTSGQLSMIEEVHSGYHGRKGY